MSRSSTSRSGWQRPLALVAAGALVMWGAAFVALETSEPPSGASVLGATKKPQPPIIDAGCDVDGVRVDYAAGFRTTPAPSQYRVVNATVSQVSPTCAGASISVRMLDGSTTLATATASATSPDVTLTFSSPASARQTTGVAVDIVGGSVPLPAPCAAMTFDRFTVLTAGSDTHPGSKDRDLTYGGSGNDVLRGDNQHDCLDGQDGDDQLVGDNHDDVLRGGEGDDTLTGGSGDDELYGGPGTDTCIGGQGKNTYDPSCETVQ